MPTGQCKLCLKHDAALVRSHLLPRSLYEMARTPSKKNSNPVMVTSKKVGTDSKQLWCYLLCKDCEQLFNKNGEDYVMRQVFNGKDFPLLDRLKFALTI